MTLHELEGARADLPLGAELSGEVVIRKGEIVGGLRASTAFGGADALVVRDELPIGSALL